MIKRSFLILHSDRQEHSVLNYSVLSESKDPLETSKGLTHVYYKKNTISQRDHDLAKN